MAGAGRRFFKAGAVFLLLAALGLAALFVLGYLFFPEDDGDFISFSTDHVAVVDVEGLIHESDTTIRRLRGYVKDPAVSAIVLRIDSPGGGVGPSQDIFREVVKARAKKPVVASMGAVAASGGYYIAAACSRIVAGPGAITGSIGVILSLSNLEGLMDKIGLKPEVIKSGKFKDAGSPYRPMSGEERAFLQGLVDNLYQQFVADVARERKMDVEAVRALADGRVFTGTQALEHKLVDELGNLQDAIRAAARLGGIEGEPVVERARHDDGLLWLLFGETVAAYLPERPPLKSGVYFLWPGW